MDKFNFRIGDLEARSTGKHLMSTNPHETVEIVKWLKEDHCYTIAFFESKKDDGWDVRLLGDRVVDEDFIILGKLIKVALAELSCEVEE